jgi:predicted CoA-binding protein
MPESATMTASPLPARIEQFLCGSRFAVIGASADPSKYGHLVFARYLARGLQAFAVNPRGGKILGHPTYPNLAALPEPVDAVSIITPPEVTERVIDEIIAAGIRNVWLQPGAESEAAIRKAEDAGVNLIHGGPCVLVALS